jgi:hypothetical protein
MIDPTVEDAEDVVVNKDVVVAVPVVVDDVDVMGAVVDTFTNFLVSGIPKNPLLPIVVVVGGLVVVFVLAQVDPGTGAVGAVQLWTDGIPTVAQPMMDSMTTDVVERCVSTFMLILYLFGLRFE